MKPLARTLLAVALCLAAAPAAAQRIEPSALANASAAPVPAVPAGAIPSARLAPEQDTVPPAPALPPAVKRDDARWNAAMIGVVVGAAVGGLIGWSAEKDVRDSLAPPAYLFTVPAGAALGFVIGRYSR